MSVSVGLFGGTFSPVHIGHLRTALELREVIGLDEMRLVPVALPPHREQPEVSAAQRLAMLQLATADEPGLVVDDCELRRAEQPSPEPSYTIDTVIALREQLGPEAIICLCIGMDSLVNLGSWHRWQELLDYVHIVVAARPGWHAPDGCQVAGLVAQRSVTRPEKLHSAPAGFIWQAELTLLPVSSTEIRTTLAAKPVRSVRYLLPEPVIGYIKENGLYR